MVQGIFILSSVWTSVSSGNDTFSRPRRDFPGYRDHRRRRFIAAHCQRLRKVHDFTAGVIVVLSNVSSACRFSYFAVSCRSTVSDWGLHIGSSFINWLSFTNLLHNRLRKEYVTVNSANCPQSLTSLALLQPEFFSGASQQRFSAVLA
jgi:hypothetical protein